MPAKTKPGKRGKKPALTHAIAQVGQMLNGRLVPNPSGPWVLVCNGKPSGSASQARTTAEATCAACRAKLDAPTGVGVR